MGLRPCSTAAEPALSMCCCSLSFCTSRHNPGQQKMKVEGSAEGWARGKRALFLIIPAICLNKPKKIFPRGNQPLGISCRQLQLLSLQHGLALAGDNEERKQDFFLPYFKEQLAFFSPLFQAVPAMETAAGGKLLTAMLGEAQPCSPPAIALPFNPLTSLLCLQRATKSTVL